MEILQDIAGKIGFEWHLALAHLINLLIIFFLLAKFALPGIKKTVEERKKKIEEGLKMRDQADKLVVDAKKQGKEIISEANKKGEEIVSRADVNAKELVHSASNNAQEILRKAEAEKAEAKEKGLKDAEGIVAKDISKILAKVSANAFSSKISGEVNNDFISKVFKI